MPQPTLDDVAHDFLLEMQSCVRAVDSDLEAVLQFCLRLSVFGFFYGRNTPQSPTK